MCSYVVMVTSFHMPIIVKSNFKGEKFHRFNEKHQGLSLPHMYNELKSFLKITKRIEHAKYAYLSKYHDFNYVNTKTLFLCELQLLRETAFIFTPLRINSIKSRYHSYSV